MSVHILFNFIYEVRKREKMLGLHLGMLALALVSRQRDKY